MDRGLGSWGLWHDNLEDDPKFTKVLYDQVAELSAFQW